MIKYIYFKEYDERHTSTIIICSFTHSPTIVTLPVVVVVDDVDLDSVLYFVKRPLTEQFALILLNNASIDIIVDLLSVDYNGWIVQVEHQRERLLEFVFFALFIIVEYWTALFAVDKFFRLYFFFTSPYWNRTRFIASQTDRPYRHSIADKRKRRMTSTACVHNEKRQNSKSK